ncbi:hypothetical protein GQ55_3G102700 [Panicum hallii var. hallii]|uniref:Uncharacterized protein n=1 Tax=Panicum hallii var. hallii TaxID=1504633 RepID=A0A2T7E7U5_9POAL|nr:hypothetical protein GQ55_3G102700 [Panicum hallii var. hallii]
MAAVTSGGRETEGRRRGVRWHFKVLRRTAGCREEGDEQAREMSGRRRVVRVVKAGDRRWKEAPTCGPHLSVSQRESRREWRRWIRAGGAAGLGRAGWAEQGRKRKKRERERRKREGRWAGL